MMHIGHYSPSAWCTGHKGIGRLEAPVSMPTCHMLARTCPTGTVAAGESATSSGRGGRRLPGDDCQYLHTIRQPSRHLDPQQQLGQSHITRWERHTDLGWARHGRAGREGAETPAGPGSLLGLAAFCSLESILTLTLGLPGGGGGWGEEREGNTVEEWSQ